MTPKQRRIHEAVCERDNEICCECGTYTLECHHIVSRRYKGAWDPRNMLLLCPDCHKWKADNAHTHAKKREHIKYLRDRFGYDYSDMGDLWQQLIREIDDEAVCLR
jgi:5-methylcytosine-specific restriction endonuclease McrA